MQAVDSRARIDELTVDFSDLVPLIQENKLIEMKPLGADYILYGVGYSATGELFSHYDSATEQSIPLGPTEDSLAEEARRSVEEVNQSTARLARTEAELRKVSKKQRRQRGVLSREVAEARKSLASKKARSRALELFYKNPERRRHILAEYQLISGQARSFTDETYDLNDPDGRKRMKTRLLSFIRPEARDVLVQIAHAYREQFDRPLPVSSLVRPLQYQRELARTNTNATRGATPPHSTGLAFDLYYKYMTAAEQEYLMLEIAHLKDQGRVEALREARDNIHVYVFGEGRRPDEEKVARLIAKTKPVKTPRKKRGSRRR